MDRVRPSLRHIDLANPVERPFFATRTIGHVHHRAIRYDGDSLESVELGGRPIVGVQVTAGAVAGDRRDRRTCDPPDPEVAAVRDIQVTVRRDRDRLGLIEQRRRDRAVCEACGLGPRERRCRTVETDETQPLVSGCTIR